LPCQLATVSDRRASMKTILLTLSVISVFSACTYQ
jgi:hypothetical protein